MNLDAFVEAGLYDPDEAGAAGRRELLVHLVGRFGQVAVIEAAGRVPLYAVALELADPPPPRLTAREVADASGADLDDVLLIRAATGFPVSDPEAREIPDVQVEDIAVAMAGIELFGRDRTLAFTRVVGGAVLQLAEAARALFASTMVEDSGGSGPSELEVSVQNEVAWATYQLLPSVVAHLMIERGDIQQSFVSDLLAGALTRTVVFVDLVGSTAWAGAEDSTGQAAALARFEQAAWEITTRRGGRLVKLIGDEAMVVAEGATAACEIAAELLAVTDADPDLPRARAGLASGDVVARAGDYYGPTVNLAARLVALAPAGGMVAPDECVAALDLEMWTTEPLGDIDIRGFAEPVAVSQLRHR